jgi:hypothetical protein
LLWKLHYQKITHYPNRAWGIQPLAGYALRTVQQFGNGVKGIFDVLRCAYHMAFFWNIKVLAQGDFWHKRRKAAFLLDARSISIAG